MIMIILLSLYYFLLFSPLSSLSLLKVYFLEEIDDWWSNQSAELHFNNQESNQ